MSQTQERVALGLEEPSLNPASILLCYPELVNETLRALTFFICENNWRITIFDSLGCCKVVLWINGERNTDCLAHSSCSGNIPNIVFYTCVSPRSYRGRPVTCAVLPPFSPQSPFLGPYLQPSHFKLHLP